MAFYFYLCVGQQFPNPGDFAPTTKDTGIVVGGTSVTTWKGTGSGI